MGLQVAMLLAGCGSSFDLGRPDAGEVGDAQDLPPPPDRQGFVNIVENFMPGMMGTTQVGARADFFDPADLFVPEPLLTSGECAVYDSSQATDAEGPALDAGSIAVGGGSRDVHLTFQGGGYGHDNLKGISQLWAEGDLLTFAAEGGADLPAFAGDVEAPPDVRVTSPSFSEWIEIDRAIPLELWWTPGGEGDVFLQIDYGETSVSCTAADADGEMVVPIAVLAELAPTPPDVGMMEGARLMVVRTARATVVGGRAIVSLEVSASTGGTGSIR